MGIMQEFCQALYKEIKAYQTKKAVDKKPLTPMRQQDIIKLIQLLEAAEKQNPTNVRILQQDVLNFINEIKVVRLAGLIPLSSDLRTQLSHVLAKPQFDPAQMAIIELQEQQANQYYMNTALNTRLTQNEQEIALLNHHLSERDKLCETLMNKCNALKIENAQLKESLKACANENTAERLSQLHQQVSEQQTTISKLTVEQEKGKNENQQLLNENQQLKQENRRLRHALKKSERASSHISSHKLHQNTASAQTPCYASPLKNALPQVCSVITPTSTSSVNTVELKAFG